MSKDVCGGAINLPQKSGLPGLQTQREISYRIEKASYNNWILIEVRDHLNTLRLIFQWIETGCKMDHSMHSNNSENLLNDIILKCKRHRLANGFYGKLLIDLPDMRVHGIITDT